MALTSQLTNTGLKPQDIETTATVTLLKTDASFTITAVHLEVSARVPGASEETFTTAANAAKTGCPISRLLKADIR